MKKDRYLKEATKKIYNFNEKQDVNTELAAHIEERTDFYKEIGYDEERADEMACESMGDAELVCDDFGRLHNTSQNPTPDLIVFALVAAAHAGAYWLLEKYAFSDSGLISLILGTILISFGLVYLFGSFSSRRVNLVSKLLNIAVIGGAGYFNFLVMKALANRTDSSFAELWAFLKNGVLPRITNYPDKHMIIIIICAAMSLSVLSFAVMLIYYIKVKGLKNRLADNRISRFFHSLTLYLSILLIIAGITLGVKSYFDIKNLQAEYIKTYDLFMNILEESNSMDDVIDALAKEGITLEENVSMREDYYNHNLVTVCVVHDDRDGSVYTACRFYMNTACFDNKFTKLTTHFIMLNGEKEDEFRRFVPTKRHDESETEFYKSYYPMEVSASFDDNSLAACEYTFTFLIGNDYYRYTLNRETVKGTEEYYDYMDFREEITALLKENPDLSAQEIANATNSEVVEADIETREEVRQALIDEGYDAEIVDKVLDNYYDSVYADYKDYIENNFSIKHGSFYAKFSRSDDYFSIEYVPDMESHTIYAFDYPLEENKYRNATVYDGAIKAVSVNSGYYDKNGLYYDEAEHIAYYTVDGTRYFLYRKTIEDPTHTVGNTFEYYLTDREGRYVKADLCFIDENGYLVIDSRGSIKYDDDSKAFKDSGGKTYFKALETSWDIDGTMLHQSDEYELIKL